MQISWHYQQVSAKAYRATNLSISDGCTIPLGLLEFGLFGIPAPIPPHLTLQFYPMIIGPCDILAHAFLSTPAIWLMTSLAFHWWHQTRWRKPMSAAPFHVNSVHCNATPVQYTKIRRETSDSICADSSPGLSTWSDNSQTDGILK